MGETESKGKVCLGYFKFDALPGNEFFYKALSYVSYDMDEEDY